MDSSQLKQILANYIAPFLGINLFQDNALKEVTLAENEVKITLKVGFPTARYKAILEKDLTTYLQPYLSGKKLILNIESEVLSRKVQAGLQVLKNVKNIIAVASGKGGVGKSTVSVNLAAALSQEGARVGILDADIYGPNQPHMLGISQKPEATESKFLKPIISHGLQSMSVGYLIQENTPVVWRGPMVSSALQQLLNDTAWDDLDYLIIDLPPGTGDVQLTLAQKIPVTASVVVTTPQDIALLDVKKAIGMFKKVSIPIMGVIENMAYYHCPQCSHEDFIFGSGGGEKTAKEYGVEFLGSLPLNAKIREQGDKGVPIVIAEPESDIAIRYRRMAVKIAATLSLKAKDYSNKFPKIVIES